ncbi:MAG TPA: VOC family protein [Polyangiales bacterium]|nr:VOC family protein [Polyangiales bacterium]
MLDKRTIIAFSATNDPERAKRFYRDVLGLPLREESPFALVFDAGGTMLRVQKTQGHKPAPHTLLGFEVPDIMADARALLERGVELVRYPGMEQDELGVWTAPDNGAKIAWFKDPDGNLLSLTQFD